MNPVDFDFTFDLASKRIVAPSQLAAALGDQALREIAKAGNHVALIVGGVAENGPYAAAIRAAAKAFAEATGAKLCRIPQGANAVGLARHGVLPTSRDARSMLDQARGAYLVYGEPAVAVALGGAIAVLLHLKDPLHAFASRIGERDIAAIMQFALITLVVLPVLPDRYYGPYETLNPFQIWLMVVLIVAIGLLGYLAYKLFGAREGAVFGGVIGGLVSSTATTVSFDWRLFSNRFRWSSLRIE